MNYNDFPILSNEEYSLINSHYSTQEKFDRKSMIFKICNEINDCKNACCHIANKYNIKIRQSIEQSKSIFNKLYENLISTFNVNIPKNEIYKSLNLFSFINKIVSLLNLILTWANNELKEYYKSIAQKTSLELINITQQIISAIEESNIFLFKHM